MDNGETKIQVFSQNFIAEDCFNIGSVPEGQFCGDCWHGRISNIVCISLFGLLSVIFFLISALMYCYHVQRKKANLGVVSKSYYIIFTFLVCWILARIVYLSEAFIQYSYKTTVIIATFPTVFTYITISIALFNV